MKSFDYNIAFSRNIGILSKSEQEKVSQTTIAIAGMGGVGGEYLISLVRAGFQHFKICDLDAFEMANFNRQFGANIQSIDNPKTHTMKEMAQAINPNCQIEVLDDPISSDNVHSFLKNCDLVVNGMDFFVLDAHQILIEAANKKGIVALAAVPFGLGAGYLAFSPEKASFEQYFRFSKAKNKHEKALLFAIGFGIGSYHIQYIDQNRINIKEKSGPSNIAGIKACSGMITTGALQTVLWPKELKATPWATHLDFRKNKIKHCYILGGNQNPIQRFKFWFAKKKYL